MDPAAYLAEVAARPLEWGRCDCCLMVADWIAVRTGVDPASDLRARYADEAGAVRAIEAEGGLVTLFERRLRKIGMTRVASPRVGDVAVVELRGPMLFGAVTCPNGWAVKTSRGLLVSRAFHPVVCWSFADG